MQDCSAAKNEVKIKKEKVQLTVFSRTRHARFLWYTGEHWKEKGWLTLDSLKVRHFYHCHGEPVAKGKLLFRCVWCVFVYDTTQTGKRQFLSKLTAETARVRLGAAWVRDEAWATAKELVNKQTWWPLTKPSVPLLNIPLHVSLILFQSSHLNLLHSWPATSDYIKSLHYPQPQVLYWNTHSLPIKSTHIYNHRPSAWTHEVVSMSNRLSLDGKLAAGPINSRQQQK